MRVSLDSSIILLADAPRLDLVVMNHGFKVIPNCSEKLFRSIYYSNTRQNCIRNYDVTNIGGPAC